jgi:hypothetical protein
VGYYIKPQYNKFIHTYISQDFKMSTITDVSVYYKWWIMLNSAPSTLVKHTQKENKK